ncbi:tRNA-uridine aminocarboxypropyltransferase 1 [Neocloeon triangulifer]|uniref:tRNA-uridine aminocarboxypropyltransferase 1 n=1 Tax=Neocloeon triangulifer TaxID=2078957 RepID=UPI00286F4A59|nr:tRNA-uridine aminocarboxypropyltransferase 1 [Neocloeon triangulifer]
MIGAPLVDVPRISAPTWFCFVVIQSEMMDSAADSDPFGPFEIADWRVLETVDGRSSCPKCAKSRKYFCYTCYVPVTELEGKIPKLKLPIKVDIIKHAKEIDGKSTSAHAAVLAPEDVTIYTFPCIPDYEQDKETIVLVFPGKEAVTVEEFLSQESQSSNQSGQKRPAESSKRKIDRAIFIDSTWNQCKGIFKDPRLKDLPCVVLKARITQFWRHQEGSPRWYLATVEAIHQLLLELDAADPEAKRPKTNSVGHRFDDLLFFFRFMYDKIHTLYDHEKLKSYKRPLK